MATIDLGNLKKADPTIFGEGVSNITGGRGGVKIFVTSLNTGGSLTFNAATGSQEAHYTGTLEAALKHQGTRHIIPYISGNINYNGGLGNAGITVSTPFGNYNNLSYHGHLAPQGGLAVINGRFIFQWVDNAIIRYLTTGYNNAQTPGQYDQFQINYSNSFAVDHCSIRWGGDEQLSLFPGDYNISGNGPYTFGGHIISRNLFGQGQPGHSRGALMGTTPTSSQTGGEMSGDFYLNYYTGVTHRYPNVTGYETSKARIINQVIYNNHGRAIVLQGRAFLDASYSYIRRNGIDSSIQLEQGIFNQYQKGYSTPPSIWSEGNIVENYLTDPNEDNTTARFWTEFWTSSYQSADFYTKATTDLPRNYFRSSPMPYTNPNEAYIPLTATQAKQSIVDNAEIGNNRATDQNGNIVKYHDTLDQFYLDAFQNNTNSTQNASTWTHPSRSVNTNHQTDTNWNGIFDGFEQENGITSSTDTQASYTWKGDTYLNPAGYDNFEVWSAIQGGAKDLLSPIIITVPELIKRINANQVIFINS